MIFNLGTGHYLMTTAIVAAMTIFFSLLIWLGVAIPYFSGHDHEGPIKFYVITGIFFTLSLLSILVPYFTARHQCKDFDTLVIENNTLILQHSFLKTQAEIPLSELAAAKIESTTILVGAKYRSSETVFWLVLTDRAGRTFESEYDEKEYLEEILKILSGLKHP